LFVVGDVADDVGNVLIAFLFVGDEGRIVVVIVVERVVDLDIVFRFRRDGLDLAGFLLGVGLLQRDHVLALGHFRRVLVGVARFSATTRRSNRSNRHDFAGVGRDDRILVQIVEL